MRDYSDVEIERLRAAAEETMQDECFILRRTRTKNSLGEPVDTFTADTSRVRCGFLPRGNMQVVGGAVTYTDVDATLRLPADTVIDQSCQVQVRARVGFEETAETYEVMSVPRLGASAVVVDLRRIER